MTSSDSNKKMGLYIPKRNFGTNLCSFVIDLQQIMGCLQRNIICFTQRLQTAEIERRSLRVEATKLRQENNQLRLETDRTQGMESEIIQLRDNVSLLVVQK